PRPQPSPPTSRKSASPTGVALPATSSPWARPNLRPGEALRLRRMVSQAIEQSDEQGPAGAVSAVSEYLLELLCEGETLPPTSQSHPQPIEAPALQTAQQYHLAITQARHEVTWSDAATPLAPEAAESSGEPAPLQTIAPIHIRFWLAHSGEVVAAERCAEPLAPPRRLPSPRPATGPTPTPSVEPAPGRSKSNSPGSNSPPAPLPPDASLQLLASDPLGHLADWLCLVPHPPESNPPGSHAAGPQLTPWREIRDVTGPVACRKTSEYRVRQDPGQPALLCWRSNLAPPSVRLAGGAAASEWQLIDGTETGEIRTADTPDWPGEVTLRQTLRLLTQLEEGQPLWQTKQVTVTLRKCD
ncbi:MAG: hypothetical protein ACKO3P_22960, partial [Planctomycetaceae bacterium]